MYIKSKNLPIYLGTGIAFHWQKIWNRKKHDYITLVRRKLEEKRCSELYFWCCSNAHCLLCDKALTAYPRWIRWQTSLYPLAQKGLLRKHRWQCIIGLEWYTILPQPTRKCHRADLPSHQSNHYNSSCDTDRWHLAYPHAMYQEDFESILMLWHWLCWVIN